MLRIIFTLLALSLAGCGEGYKVTLGGADSDVRCIGGYRFAVVLADKSVAVAQIMPPQTCG